MCHRAVLEVENPICRVEILYFIFFELVFILFFNPSTNPTLPCGKMCSLKFLIYTVFRPKGEICLLRRSTTNSPRAPINSALTLNSPVISFQVRNGNLSCPMDKLPGKHVLANNKKRQIRFTVFLCKAGVRLHFAMVPPSPLLGHFQRNQEPLSFTSG